MLPQVDPQQASSVHLGQGLRVHPTPDPSLCSTPLQFLRTRCSIDDGASYLLLLLLLYRILEMQKNVRRDCVIVPSPNPLLCVSCHPCMCLTDRVPISLKIICTDLRYPNLNRPTSGTRDTPNNAIIPVPICTYI